MVLFKIRIVSDTTCPWCYIAKKQLDKAIAAYHQKHPSSQSHFQIDWLPFYLNPGRFFEGIDKKSYYDAKYGKSEAEAIFSRLAAVGTENGIKFSFGGRTGNTRKSHRLIHHTKKSTPEAVDQLVDNIFRGFFEEEQDITSTDFLATAAKEAGLDESKARELLEGEEGGIEVDEQVSAAQRNNVRSVPNITLQDRYQVGSFQDTDAFISVLEELASHNIEE